MGGEYSGVFMAKISPIKLCNVLQSRGSLESVGDQLAPSKKINPEKHQYRVVKPKMKIP
jgi:hypothetical protein